MTAVLDRLSFGRKKPDGNYIEDIEWAAFEDAFITPAFPAGYTVAAALGAWQDKNSGVTIHEPSMILDVIHEDEPEADHKLTTIASVYKTMFAQDAVMRSKTPVEVSFL